jgi:hypothetical protein
VAGGELLLLLLLLLLRMVVKSGICVTVALDYLAPS